MKIQSMLDQAYAVKDDEQAKAMHEMVRMQFDAQNNFSHLKPMSQNDEAYFEDGCGAHIRLEYANLLSDDYAIQVQIELREGSLKTYVSLIHFKDGNGAGSQNYAAVEEMDFDYDLLTHETAKFALHDTVGIAKTMHQDFARKIGLNSESALAEVDKLWATVS